MWVNHLKIIEVFRPETDFAVYYSVPYIYVFQKKLPKIVMALSPFSPTVDKQARAVLQKTAKLLARINSEKWSRPFTRACLGKAGFEVYSTNSESTAWNCEFHCPTSNSIY
jgi:hypothetical protein